MRCYFCHICEKEFYSKNVKETEQKCLLCGAEFIEEIELTHTPQPDVDSQGNEFLSCDNEDDWEDEEEEKVPEQTQNINQPIR
mgnify:CR=1 FL=1|jgi:hypothetical protein